MLAALALAALALPASALAGGRGPDGRYEGKVSGVGDNAIDQVEIFFDVEGKGGKVTDWHANLNVVCSTFPVSVEYVQARMPVMKVKRNGSFRKVFEREIDDVEARIEVSGKLVGKRVTKGTFSYEVGLCQRGDDPGDPMRWTAARTR